MKSEFPQSEKFPRSGLHTPLLRLGLKANVLMYFVNLSKTEPPRWKHLIINIRRDFMLCESQKVTLIGFLN